MRFTCEFFNPDREEAKAVTVALTAAECESVNGIRDEQGEECADLIAKSFAMKHAYSEIPRGFTHTAPPQFVPVH